MLTSETIDKVKQQNITTLVALDARGLIVAPNESAEAFAQRLETLKIKLDDFKTQVKTKPFYEINDCFAHLNLFQNINGVPILVYWFIKCHPFVKFLTR